MDDTHLVFVYGTLREGQGNNRLVYSDKDTVHYGTRVSDLSGWDMFTCGFPAVRKNDRNEHYIIGDLYRVSTPTLMRLDGLEGHPHFYERKAYNLFEDFSPVWIYTIDDAPEQGFKPLPVIDNEYDWVETRNFYYGI